MGQLDPGLKLVFFLFFGNVKKNTDPSFKLGSGYKYKSEERVNNLLYLFILFIKIKKSAKLLPSPLPSHFPSRSEKKKIAPRKNLQSKIGRKNPKKRGSI
jgi:hypothetical protein